MSRIGRDQEDRAGIRKRLQFASVRLATPVDGIVSSLTDGIRAVIDSQQLEDLKHQIRRGMEGVVRDGRHAGGRAYGYHAIPGKPGELEIVPAEAAIVRRIFKAYLAGEMPRQIAHALNAENIPPPRGAWWGSSAIQGSNNARMAFCRMNSTWGASSGIRATSGSTRTRVVALTAPTRK